LNKALLDTDILSELIKGVNPIVVGHGDAYYQAFGRYTFSVVTLMEIVRGFQRKQSVRRLQTFLLSVSGEEILAFDEEAAELAGRIAGDLERAGQTIGVADPMIAATALMNGLELATGNVAHFQRIQQLGYPLVVRSWRI
jgi:tRNA(fMet)-specific endonuclease VapC